MQLTYKPCIPPQYLQFSYPPNTSRVKVQFLSQDNTSHICAIASIQTTYVSFACSLPPSLYISFQFCMHQLICSFVPKPGYLIFLTPLQRPVVELLDNPDHRGTFQTMRSKAAINTRVSLIFSHYLTVALLTVSTCAACTKVMVVSLSFCLSLCLCICPLPHYLQYAIDQNWAIIELLMAFCTFATRRFSQKCFVQKLWCYLLITATFHSP